MVWLLFILFYLSKKMRRYHWSGLIDRLHPISGPNIYHEGVFSFLIGLLPDHEFLIRCYRTPAETTIWLVVLAQCRKGPSSCFLAHQVLKVKSSTTVVALGKYSWQEPIITRNWGVSLDLLLLYREASRTHENPPVLCVRRCHRAHRAPIPLVISC